MNYKLKKTVIMGLILVVFSLTFTRFLKGINASASTDIPQNTVKCFTSYVVASGDSLWSIADSHMDHTYTVSINDYIQDIITSNDLGKDGYIYEGQLLILPYYSVQNPADAQLASANP